LLITTSCQNKEVPPSTIPFIEFVKTDIKPILTQSGIREGDSLLVHINYTDGDSDIGNYFSAASGPSFDFFAKPYVKNNGVFKEWRPDNYLTFDGMLPKIDNPKVGNIYENGAFKITVKNKYQGEILYKLVLLAPFDEFNSIQIGDTVRFEIYIKDRAPNTSNTITTQEFIFMKP